MAAPIGNKFAVGLEITGRPPIYSDPKVMADKLVEYIELIKENNENLTITGICLYLGFESRQSFYAYEDKQEFCYIIQRARMIVENAHENGLYGNTATGHIFALKNMGWKDRNETELSGPNGTGIVLNFTEKERDTREETGTSV
jgi:hypothetical protein